MDYVVKMMLYSLLFDICQERYLECIQNQRDNQRLIVLYIKLTRIGAVMFQERRAAIVIQRFIRECQFDEDTLLIEQELYGGAAGQIDSI